MIINGNNNMKSSEQIKTRESYRMKRMKHMLIKMKTNNKSIQQWDCKYIFLDWDSSL